MSDKSKRAVPLNREDRERMAKLYEEVASRLVEMGMIVARTLGLDPKSHAPVFERRKDEDRKMADMVVESEPFVRLISNQDRTSTGCYSYLSSAVMLCGGKPGDGRKSK
jgi:hypothetical protein